MDVAEHQGDSFVPLRDVAARQEISEKYLEIVVKELVKGGLLTVLRGKGGGYRLNRAPEEYNVKSILELMDWVPEAMYTASDCFFISSKVMSDPILVFR